MGLLKCMLLLCSKFSKGYSSHSKSTTPPPVYQVRHNLAASRPRFLSSLLFFLHVIPAHAARLCLRHSAYLEGPTPIIFTPNPIPNLLQDLASNVFFLVGPPLATPWERRAPPITLCFPYLPLQPPYQLSPLMYYVSWVYLLSVI